MKALILVGILLLALATPAMAQTTTYPPTPPPTSPPPVCVNPPCHTAHTGSDLGRQITAALALLGIGAVLLAGRRSMLASRRGR